MIGVWYLSVSKAAEVGERDLKTNKHVKAQWTLGQYGTGQQ
jgi:hypothetical protein